jgi:putative transposase
LRELASERRRFGYRRLLILLRREGFEVNHKRLFRLYREERLTVRKRGNHPAETTAGRVDEASGIRRR